MKRVILVVPVFPKLSETFIVSKFLGLLDQGWDAHVVCGVSEPREWALFPSLGRNVDIKRRVHVCWIHRPSWLAALLLPATLLRCFNRNPVGTWRYLRGSRTTSWFGALRLLYLDAEMICLKPDLIHFEFGSLAVGRMHLKALLDSKVSVSFRGYDLNHVGLDEPGFYDEVWSEADALHLLGEALWKRAYLRGCPPRKLHALIAPAVDTVFFDPGNRRHTEVVGVPDRPLRILSVGRLEWKKGYEYALQAVRLLADQGIDCEYRVIGDGDYLEAVSFARHQFGLEGIVHLLGAQPRSEVKAHMQWADILVHSAVSEGFCNVVMEAQAMSLPVVCSDADGLDENVSNKETGFVVPRRDAQALVEKMVLLARDPNMRQQMGELGRRRVLTHFRLEDQKMDFDRLFRLVLAHENLNSGDSGAPFSTKSAQEAFEKR